jgi:hypothetical protein
MGEGVSEVELARLRRAMSNTFAGGDAEAQRERPSA